MAEATIGSLSGVIDLMRQENNVRNDELKKSQQGTEKNTSDLNKTMREILDQIKQDSLQNEEDRREKKKEPTFTFKVPEIKGAGDVGIGGLLLGISAMIGRTIKFLLDQVKFGLLLVKDSISKLFNGPLAFMKNLFDKGKTTLIRTIRNFYKAFTFGFFKALDGSLRFNVRDANNRFKKLNFVEKIFSSIGKIFGFVSKPFAMITTWWNKSGLGNFMNSKSQSTVQRVFGFFGKIFKFLNDTLKATLSIGGGLFSAGGRAILSVIKTVFSKILWPIQIIISLFDFFGGFMGDWERTANSDMNIFTRILSATWEGIKDVFIGFFGSIGDLIMKGIYWLLDSIGLGSITDRMNELIPGGISGMIGSLFDWVRKLFSSPLEALKEIFTKFLPWLGQLGMTIFMSIMDIAKWAFKGILDGLGYLFGTLLPAIGTWIMEKIGEFAEWLGQALLDGWNYILEIPGRVASAFGEAFSSLMDWWDNEPDKWGSILEAAGELWDNIKSWAKSLFTDAWDALTDWYDKDTDTAAMRETPPPVNDAVDTSATPPPPVNRDSSNAGTNRGTPENAQRAVNFFVDKGLTAEQAAGIVGNLQAESGQNLNPNARRDNDAGPGLHSYGIAQWNRDRWNGLNAFARERGKPWNDFDTQLEYIWHELNGRESAALQRLRATTSAADAAAVIDQYYERSSGEHRQRRIANAARLSPSGEGMLSPPSSTNRTNAGEMLASAGSMAPNLGSLFAQVNVGGSSTSNTNINNNTTQAIMGSPFDASAMFGGPWMQAAQALSTS